VPKKNTLRKRHAPQVTRGKMIATSRPASTKARTMQQHIFFQGKAGRRSVVSDSSSRALPRGFPSRPATLKRENRGCLLHPALRRTAYYRIGSYRIIWDVKDLSPPLRLTLSEQEELRTAGLEDESSLTPDIYVVSD